MEFGFIPASSPKETFCFCWGKRHKGRQVPFYCKLNDGKNPYFVKLNIPPAFDKTFRADKSYHQSCLIIPKDNDAPALNDKLNNSKTRLVLLNGEAGGQIKITSPYSSR